MGTPAVAGGLDRDPELRHPSVAGSPADVDALRAQAKLITETESKTRERFQEFNKLVKEDLKRLNSMIAAAEALGQKMPEEQKKRVLG